MKRIFIVTFCLTNFLLHAQVSPSLTSKVEWRIAPTYSTIEGEWANRGFTYGDPFKQGVNDVIPCKVSINENEIAATVSFMKDKYGVVKIDKSLKVNWETPVGGIPVRLSLLGKRLILVTDRAYKMLKGYTQDYTIYCIDVETGKILQSKSIESCKGSTLFLFTSETGEYFYAGCKPTKASDLTLLNYLDDLQASSFTIPGTAALQNPRFASDPSGNLYVSDCSDDNIVSITQYSNKGEKRNSFSIPFSTKKKKSLSFYLYPVKRGGYLYVAMKYAKDNNDYVSEVYQLDFVNNKRTGNQVVLNSDFKKEIKASYKNLNENIDKLKPDTWNDLLVEHIVEVGDQIIVWHELTEVYINNSVARYKTSNAIFTAYDQNFNKIYETVVPKRFDVSAQMAIGQGSSFKVKDNKVYFASASMKPGVLYNVIGVYDAEAKTITQLITLSDYRIESPDPRATLWFDDGFAMVVLRSDFDTELQKLPYF